MDLMIVWSTLETACPVCQHRLRIRELGGGVALGQDTDLLVRMKGKHVIQAEVHTCQNCKFSGQSDDFTLRNFGPQVIERFFDDVLCRLDEVPKPAGTPSTGSHVASKTPLPHVQYYWAALAGPVIGLTPTEIGLRYLRAYWCLRLTPSVDLPAPRLQLLKRAYLREAIAHLRAALRDESKRSMVYLVGELCRRNGNFGLARHYFDRYLHRESGPRYLKQAAEKLLEVTRREDASERSMEKLLYG